MVKIKHLGYLMVLVNDWYFKDELINSHDIFNAEPGT